MGSSVVQPTHYPPVFGCKTLGLCIPWLWLHFIAGDNISVALGLYPPISLPLNPLSPPLLHTFPGPSHPPQICFCSAGFNGDQHPYHHPTLSSPPPPLLSLPQQENLQRTHTLTRTPRQTKTRTHNQLLAILVPPLTPQ